jgi:hypothetical protein
VLRERGERGVRVGVEGKEGSGRGQGRVGRDERGGGEGTECGGGRHVRICLLEVTTEKGEEREK